MVLLKIPSISFVPVIDVGSKGIQYFSDKEVAMRNVDESYQFADESRRFNIYKTRLAFDKNNRIFRVSNNSDYERNTKSHNSNSDQFSSKNFNEATMTTWSNSELFSKNIYPETNKNNIVNIPTVQKARYFEMHEPKSVRAFLLEKMNRIQSERYKEQSNIPYQTSKNVLPQVMSENMIFNRDPIKSRTQSQHSMSSRIKTFDAIWESEQEKRRKLVHSSCKENSDMFHPTIDNLTRNRHLIKNFIVDDEHQVLYCYVPKVIFIFNYDTII